MGVIDSTWGGTVAEAWTRMAALGEDAALAPVFAAMGQDDRAANRTRCWAARRAAATRRGEGGRESRSRSFHGIRS